MKKLLVLIALLAVAAIAMSTGVAQAGAPSNDNFGNATVISYIPWTDNIVTSDATSAPNDPSACESYSHSVWYQYTPAFPQDFDVNTNGSSYDTVLAIYTGAKGALHQIACDDDSGTGNNSALKVNLLVGTTYYFLAAGYGSNSGSLYFNLDCQTNCPAPNLFEDPAKCYQVKPAKSSFHFQRQEILTLDVNFELGTATTLLGLSLYCTPVLQTLQEAAGEAPAETIRRTCYTIRDKNQHANQDVFVQTKVSEAVLTVGKAQSMCVLAVKTRGQLPDFGDPDGVVLKCYAARPAAGSPRFQTVSANLIDQFSAKEGKFTTILRPVSFCNFSKKLVPCPDTGPCPDGDPTTLKTEFVPNSIVCYAIRQASFRPFNIPVIDQFIDQHFDADDPLLTVKKADSLCLLATKKKPAPNDNITHATSVELAYCASGPVGVDCFEDHTGTTNATKQKGDPVIRSCESLNDGFAYGHSVWYTFTPSPGYTDVDIDTFYSTYDTVLAVYTGTPGHLTQIACNDDIAHGKSDASHVKLHLDPYQKYWILVGAHGSDAGGKLKFRVTVQELCFPPGVPDLVAGPPPCP